MSGSEAAMSEGERTAAWRRDSLLHLAGLLAGQRAARRHLQFWWDSQVQHCIRQIGDVPNPPTEGWISAELVALVGIGELGGTWAVWRLLGRPAWALKAAGYRPEGWQTPSS